MSVIRKLFLHSPKSYIIALSIATVIAVIRLATTGFDLLFYYIDALTIAGAIIFLVGMLAVVSKFGAFDMFRYSFSSLRRSGKYKDYYEYESKKQETRTRTELTFMCYFTVGAVFLIVGFSLYIFMP